MDSQKENVTPARLGVLATQSSFETQPSPVGASFQPQPPSVPNYEGSQPQDNRHLYPLIQPSPRGHHMGPQFPTSHHGPAVTSAPYSATATSAHPESYTRYPEQGTHVSISARNPSVSIPPLRQVEPHRAVNKFRHYKAPALSPLSDESGRDEEGLGVDNVSASRPFKRIRYEPHDIKEERPDVVQPMPPPHPHAWQYNSYTAYQTSYAPTIRHNSINNPMTPSSTCSDELYRTFPLKAATPFITAQNSPDFRRLSQDTNDTTRRLSVESLLSGPPGMGDEPPRRQLRTGSDARGSYSSSAGSNDIMVSMKTWGVDRGFRDLDVGRNDDEHAIEGIPPDDTRDYVSQNGEAETEDVPAEFGFGVKTKDIPFDRDYYAQPVTIKLPQSFEPLPPELTHNQMNLLYFHHFISHTARLLVPHHCSSNPFQKILPQMAIRDPNLLNLLLAYSASHRARLLQQPEPSTRIAMWVKDVFPNLRQALKDPKTVVSNSNLAAAIMLASLEIISPKAFGVSVSWQQYLLTARAMVHARGGVKSMFYDRSDVSHFLLRWFAYIDVLGSLIDAPTEVPTDAATPQSPTLQRYQSSWLGEYDFEPVDDYQIDCLFGFTGRCITLLALIAELARACDLERIDSNHEIRPDWQPSEDVKTRAEKLMNDVERARTSTRVQPCPHLHSADEATYQWDTQEMVATNEAYHWAGLVHIHRRILGKPTLHPDVQHAVQEICGALYKVRKGSSAENCLLFPIFTAGCELGSPPEGEQIGEGSQRLREMIMERFDGIEKFGMSQVHKARGLMLRVWETGKPWETLVSGEFVG
jgi:hypothetical protein